MSISKKMYLLIALATINSMTSFCAEDGSEHPRKQLQQQPQLPGLGLYAQNMSNTYATVSEKCEIFYNPVGLASIAISSAAMGLKRLGVLGIAGAAIVNSDLIIAAANDYLERVKKDNLEDELKKAK